MFTRKIRLFLLPLLIATILLIPTGIAADVSEPIENSADSFISWTHSHSGKKVSAAECLEISAPEHWANLTQEQRNAYRDLNVVLPDFYTFNQQSGSNYARAYATRPSSKGARVGAAFIIEYMATANSYTGAIPFTINHWASTANTCNGAPSAFPETTVIADLMKWDGSKWVRVESGDNTGYFTSFVEVWKNKFFPESESYCTFSQHFGEFPAGAVPSVYYLSMKSNTVYYD